jgi:hypothetical protein
MATELYNVLKTVIDPRYMSIFKFKKDKRYNFLVIVLNQYFGLIHQILVCKL